MPFHLLNPLPIIGPWWKRVVGKWDRRDAAADTFRRAVLKELRGLYPRPVDWPEKTGIDKRLRAVFPAMQEAIEGFRPYVKDQQAFEEAWRSYRTSTKRDIDNQDYTHYMNFGTHSQNLNGDLLHIKQDGKANFKRNVDRLLNFAKEP
jgi:hypothetical protein